MGSAGAEYGHIKVHACIADWTDAEMRRTRTVQVTGGYIGRGYQLWCEVCYLGCRHKRATPFAKTTTMGGRGRMVGKAKRGVTE